MNSGPRRWKLRVFRRGLFALLLSVLSPGLGQVYNGELLRGLLLYASVPAFLKLAGVLGMPQSYRGLVAFVALAVLLFGLIVADAVWRASRRAPASRPKRGWRALLLAAAMLLVTLAALVGRVPDRLLGAHPYEFPDESMAPTVLPNDWFIVDLRYYANHAPQRGDVVAVATPIGTVTTFTRIIALPGDVIEGTPTTTKVNGRAVYEPYLKYLPDAEHDPGGMRLTFGPVTVPAGRVFLMGDYRSHSYDSRRFGALDAARLSGKLLYIFWSADRSRIGRSVR